MSTFTLPSPYPSIPVTIPQHESLSKEELLKFPAFKSWISRLTSALQSENNVDNYELKKIDITSVTKFSSGKIGFVMLNAEVKNPKEEKGLPGTVLLRGPSVCILVLLHPRGSPPENLYAVLTLQPRIAGATVSMAEIPAGMLDESGSFSGAAAKELEEEVGIKIPADKLINLSELALSLSPLLHEEEYQGKKEIPGLANAPPVGDDSEQKLDGLFSSGGLLDEVLTYHAYVHEVEEKELEDWKGKLTGLRDQGEKISLKLIKFDDLWKATRDMKALGAWGLWKGLKSEGKI